MPATEANGILICYEAMGDPADPTLLLVMGLGCQLVEWDEPLCQKLVEHGFHVLRYDNRDVGLSTKMDDAPVPDLLALAGGDASSASYTVEDMADDAAGLLEALDIERAHVVGASMGGMIAQALAIRHPDRVASLCSIMSTTGAPDVGQPSAEAVTALLQPPGETREEAIEANVVLNRVIGSTGFPFDEAAVRERAARAYDRDHSSAGVTRQAAAILASPDRTERLHAVRVPTVVIHGEADPLIHPSGGEATARAVPGARLITVPGMGHDLPEETWPLLLEAVLANAERAGFKAAASP
ncbi:MAG: alpha/beta fold hydrolase [Acidimicrobiales bacterium]|nr:alpha/beta fold hydrolase [Acidimicrobiales bacterium]MBO0893141.1 alpha/beta fold hydrolase [Acidimicrobiales bacterium]